MHLTELLMAAAVTISVAGVSYAAFDPEELVAATGAVTEQVSCRAVDTAIVGYVSVRDQEPESVADLAGYVKGDISAYRIVGGVAAGPGC